MKRAILSLMLVGALLAGVSAQAWSGEEGPAGVRTLGETDEKGGEKIVDVKVLEGQYIAEGTQGGGKSAYKGMVAIKRVGETYELTWTFNGQVAYQGIGLVEGDRLCVSCLMKDKPCAVVYKIEKDKTLKGRWTVIPGVVDLETLTYNGKVI